MTLYSPTKLMYHMLIPSGTPRLNMCSVLGADADSFQNWTWQLRNVPSLFCLESFISQYQFLSVIENVAQSRMVCITMHWSTAETIELFHVDTGAMLSSFLCTRISVHKIRAHLRPPRSTAPRSRRFFTNEGSKGSNLPPSFPAGCRQKETKLVITALK